MIVLTTSGQFVGLRRPSFILTFAIWWTRFLEGGNWLEVTGGNGLGVVPSDFEGSETHFLCVIVSLEQKSVKKLEEGRWISFRVSNDKSRGDRRVEFTETLLSA